MSDACALHAVQYASAAHQEGSAVAGMWLFLATEMLFFGGLVLAWIYARTMNLDGFDAGAGATALWIGIVNTVLLLTSSFVFSLGALFARAGDNRRVLWCCLGALVLALGFLALKFGLEWHDDIRKHLFPGDPGFHFHGRLEGGARLFFVFYFVATGLHGVHMLAGIVLVGIVAWRAHRGAFSPRYHTPVTVVGLYWSFVDAVWLILFPLIYLIGRR